MQSEGRASILKNVRPSLASRSQLSSFKAAPWLVRAGGKEPANLKPTITSTRQPRQTAPPPEQVPVEHSSTFLLRSRKPLEEEDDLTTTSGREDEPFTGNAVEWYLRRLDKSVGEGKTEPSAAAKAYYTASQTQAGNSAAKSMGSVVGAAAKLGAGAAKAAAPVGKWAVMKGLEAAGKMLTSSGRKPDPKKDKE